MSIATSITKLLETKLRENRGEFKVLNDGQLPKLEIAGKVIFATEVPYSVLTASKSVEEICTEIVSKVQVSINKCYAELKRMHKGKKDVSFLITLRPVIETPTEENKTLYVAYIAVAAY